MEEFDDGASFQFGELLVPAVEVDHPNHASAWFDSAVHDAVLSSPPAEPW